MSRNDIHSPKNFQPQDYEYVDHFGVFSVDNFNGERHFEQYGEEVFDTYQGQDNPHQDIQQCDLCGARFVHGAGLIHKPTGLLITVGGTCMEGIAGVRSLSNGEKWARANQARRDRERAGKMRSMLAEHPGLNAALKVDHYISRDLRANAIKWGSLSDKQIELAFKVQKDEANKPAETPAGPVPITDKRIELTATILGTKVQETMYGTQEKMLVQVDLGDGTACKLWGTLPQAVKDAQWDRDKEMGEWPSLKQTQLKFNAKVEPSKDDPNFGFLNRPTKVKVIKWGN